MAVCFFSFILKHKNTVKCKRIILRKHLYLITCSFFILNIIHGQVQHDINRTFYIVRHAEKDTGNNPSISEIGKHRAGDLYRKLKNKKIDIILVSQYRRTAMTADSLRIYQHIDTLHYLADATAADLFKKINALPASAKTILVIGHSNTLPVIIKMAGVKDFVLKEIPDEEYDNLFFVKQKKNKSIFRKEKYGRKSLPAAPAHMNISQ
jgi:phosphohistidine phosphatase SixA